MPFLVAQGLKWWRPSWRDLVSWLRYVPLQKFVTYVLMLITLIEILFSRPIDIFQIFVFVSIGVFVMYVNGLC
jgi:hypothetical protein